MRIKRQNISFVLSSIIMIPSNVRIAGVNTYQASPMRVTQHWFINSVPDLKLCVFSGRGISNHLSNMLRHAPVTQS